MSVHWQALLLGAEPIRHTSLDLFVNKFAPLGFNPKVPCYAIASIFRPSSHVTLDAQLCICVFWCRH